MVSSRLPASNFRFYSFTKQLLLRRIRIKILVVMTCNLIMILTCLSAHCRELFDEKLPLRHRISFKQRIAHESSELKILLYSTSTKRERELFLCFLRQTGKEKRKSSLTGVPKNCFSSRDVQKKIKLYWYMLLKRVNLNTVFTQISTATLIQSNSKDVNSVID